MPGVNWSQPLPLKSLKAGQLDGGEADRLIDPNSPSRQVTMGMGGPPGPMVPRVVKVGSGSVWDPSGPLLSVGRALACARWIKTATGAGQPLPLHWQVCPGSGWGQHLGPQVGEQGVTRCTHCATQAAQVVWERLISKIPK